MVIDFFLACYLSELVLLDDMVLSYVFLQVAEFLEKKRDVMYLEFDISVANSVRDTFLSTGNDTAFQVSIRMHKHNCALDRVFFDFFILSLLATC